MLLSPSSPGWDCRFGSGHQRWPHQPGDLLSWCPRPHPYRPAWHCKGSCQGPAWKHWTPGAHATSWICCHWQANLLWLSQAVKTKCFLNDFLDQSWLNQVAESRVDTQSSYAGKPLLDLYVICFQIKRLIRKFITKQETISLVVVPCNVDIATTEALKMAQEVDPEGDRTLGKLWLANYFPISGCSPLCFSY